MWIQQGRLLSYQAPFIDAESHRKLREHLTHRKQQILQQISSLSNAPQIFTSIIGRLEKCEHEIQNSTLFPSSPFSSPPTSSPAVSSPISPPATSQHRKRAFSLGNRARIPHSHSYDSPTSPMQMSFSEKKEDDLHLEDSPLNIPFSVFLSFLFFFFSFLFPFFFFLFFFFLVLIIGTKGRQQMSPPSILKRQKKKKKPKQISSRNRKVF